MTRWTSCAVFAVAVLASRVAGAEVCTRPTDPGGYVGYTYAPEEVRTFDTANVRVWYTMAGVHAVRTASSRTDGVPDDVADVAAVTDDALGRYAAMGYRPPVSDADPTCGSNGGDGRLDVYLVHFTGGDGHAAAERCVTVGAATQCASFILAQSNFEGLYDTVGEGIRTVLPHEAFHAVQNAYDAELDRFWAEGTAQWAAKRLSPSLRDLEKFLPSFFEDTARSLDAPPGGVTAGFLYGSAIWPVFLSQKYDADLVKSVFEEEGATGAPALDAAASVLTRSGSSLADAFTVFSAYNAATGSRAGEGGYADAGEYPMVRVDEMSIAVGASGVISGLASYFYHVAPSGPYIAEIDADPARTRAVLLPLHDGRASLDGVAPLPTRVDGEAIVVVSGITTKKSDARFTINLVPVVEEPPPPPPADAPPSSDAPNADGGCAIAVGPRASDPPVWAGGALLVFGLMHRRVRGRRRMGFHPSP